MRLVAHDGAHVTLWVVVLGFWKAVVDHEHGTCTQAVSECADYGLALGVDFSQIVVITRNFYRGAKCRDLISPREFGWLAWLRFKRQSHATLKPHPILARKQLDRHGIEHLIANHHTLHRVW